MKTKPLNLPTPNAAQAYVLKNGCKIFKEESTACNVLGARVNARTQAENRETHARTLYEQAEAIAEELRNLRDEFQPDCDNCEADATTKIIEEDGGTGEILCDGCAQFQRDAWDEKEQLGHDDAEERGKLLREAGPEARAKAVDDAIARADGENPRDYCPDQDRCGFTGMACKGHA